MTNCYSIVVNSCLIEKEKGIYTKDVIGAEVGLDFTSF